MTWNYRVVQRQRELAVYSAYYDEDGGVHSISASAAALNGENVDELRSELERFRQALDKAVLQYDAFVGKPDDAPRATREELDVFSDASNLAVIRARGRQFPGVLIQGDSLSIMYSWAVEALTAIKQGDATEAAACLTEVCDGLRARLEHYEQVLRSHGIGLPYSVSVATDQQFAAHRWPPADE